MNLALSGQNQYLLHTVNGDIDVQANFSQQNNLILEKENPYHGNVYKIIQFYSIPTQEQREKLEQTGIKLFNYLPQNAYFASIPVTLNSTTLNGFNIRSTVDIDDRFKMASSIFKKEYPGWAIIENNSIQLIVSCFTNVDLKTASEELDPKLFTIIKLDTHINTITLQTNISNISSIASKPFVSLIEPINPPGEPENLPGRTDHRSNAIATEFASGRHYDGAGVKIAMFDDGTIGPHIDYTGRIGAQYTTASGGVEHGDHVSGIMMGAGNLNPRYRGMGSGATLYVYDAAPSYSGFDSMYTHYTNPGIVITSTSYSDGCNAGYTSFSNKLDNQLRTMPSLIHVFSAGNNGMSDCLYGAGAGWGNITGGHKIAKNVITVANLDSMEAVNFSSSRGPASDGRLKPDVSAIGTEVYSTQPNNNYINNTGTSMSCPGVSGLMSQLYQAFKTLNSGANPNGGLMKAILMNGCDDIGNIGPDFTHGYGRVNALNSVKTIEAGNYLSTTITQTTTNNHTIVVPTGTKQLRVMLYWTDYESSPTSGSALVNDLNMQVKQSSPVTTYNPWILDPTPFAANLSALAVRGIDNLNNSEQVTIDNPVAGTYTISINGFSVPQGPQEYFVTYMFLDDAVTLTYPMGGEGFVPGEQEIIRWDAYGSTSTFALEYSTNNGSNWNSIASSINAVDRSYIWTVPSVVTGQALVRVTRGSSNDVSDANFTIVGIPQNISVAWACPDSIKLTWNAVAGATGYEVSKLGSMYMDSIGRSSTNSCVVYGFNPNLSYWLSVKSLTTNNGEGRRAVAIQKLPGTISCLLPYDAHIIEIISPSGGSIPSCQNLTAVSVKIRIQNNGVNSISNIPVHFNGASTTINEVYTGTITPGNNAVYTFTSSTINISSTGNYNMLAWATLSNDGNSYNDSLTMISSIAAGGTSQTLPYNQNFETFSLCSTSSFCEQDICSLSGNWNNVANLTDDDIDWRTNSGSTPSSFTGPDIDHNPGTSSGNYLYLEASFCWGKRAELVSPCINLTSTSSAQLSFWYNMYGSDMGDMHVDVMTNGSWTNDVMTTLSGDQGSSWLNATVNLNPFIGNNINIRFRGVTGVDLRSDMAIDDVSITGVIGIVDNSNLNGNISIYPNPGKNIFNLSFIQLTGEAVLNLFDAEGRLVMTKTINEVQSYRGELDLHHLNDGVYFLAISSEGKTYNKKIVKISE